MSEKKPVATGRYWVYPYRTLDGHSIVAMATFSKGEWDEHSRKQDYAYWKPLDFPKPPSKKELENITNYSNDHILYHYNIIPPYTAV